LLATFPAATISSAQVILTASLASAPSATFTLTSTSTPPPAIFAAAIGAGIPWDAWFAALADTADVLLLFYGPGYLKVRVGDAQVADVWSEESQGSVTPISQLKAVAPLLQISTGARLRAMLLSARVRSMRRAQQTAASPIRIPSLLLATSDSDSDSSSDSDSESDSGCSSTSSKFTSYSATSLTTFPPSTPLKCLSTLPSVAPAIYRAPKSRAPTPKAKPTAVPVDRSKKDLTAYLYQGGVTRVMTGGVMLGPRSLVRATRS
jgi:hypothetical protein